LPAAAAFVTGCAIIDPDWQQSDNSIATSHPAIPAPPQQWEPEFGHEDKQMQNYNRDYEVP
jgi:hypothetical protein